MSGIEGVAAQAAHVLTCTRCRMGWECGGLSEDDYANGARILPILDGGVVECGVCHCMVSADSVSWCFTSDEEGEYAVCRECESGPLLNSLELDS